jgi:hypothetical protein
MSGPVSEPTWGNRIRLNAKTGDVDQLDDPSYESEEEAKKAAHWISLQVNKANNKGVTQSITTLSQKVHFSTKDYRSVEIYRIEDEIYEEEEDSR